jgi:hypothetical protein
MWLAALACSVALAALAFAPWLASDSYDVEGARLPLALGVSRAALLAAFGVAMALICLTAIRHPQLRDLAAPVLTVVALAAFILCAWTASADWRLMSCGLGGLGVEGNRICVSSSDIVGGGGASVTFYFWAATAFSAILMIWSSALWFLPQRATPKVSEVGNGWA